MKVVILAGGRGTRLAEETTIKPKPMVEIGENPILWHIMKLYDFHGFHDFIIALGYKGDIIKDYFLRYQTSNNDIEIDLKTGKVQLHQTHQCHWNVRMIDTGFETMTGGRLKRLEPFVSSDTPLMMTYGDGVSNVNVHDLVRFHKSHGKIATITAVRPPARFGTMKFDGDAVVDFTEKHQSGEGWINGGFFVFQPEIFDYLVDDTTILERDPLENLAKDGQLMAYRHEGFWQCMDTMRDKIHLEELCANNNTPWMVWE